MEIVTLAGGEDAPIDSDCISVDQQPDGSFTLTGSVLSGDESVALVGIGHPHATREAATAEGMAWAAENGVRRLYVATSRTIAD